MIKTYSRRLLYLIVLMLLLSLSLMQGCTSKVTSTSASAEKQTTNKVIDQAGQGEQDFDFKQIYRK